VPFYCSRPPSAWPVASRLRNPRHSCLSAMTRGFCGTISLSRCCRLPVAIPCRSSILPIPARVSAVREQCRPCRLDDEVAFESKRFPQPLNHPRGIAIPQARYDRACHDRRRAARAAGPDALDLPPAQRQNPLSRTASWKWRRRAVPSALANRAATSLAPNFLYQNGRICPRRKARVRRV
jgi:hypothetical protein